MLIVDNHFGLFIFKYIFKVSMTYIEHCAQIVSAQLDEFSLNEHPMLAS